MMLVGNHQCLASLRLQLPRLQVKRREFTGVGFFATFAFSGRVAAAPLKRVWVGGVAAEIPPLKNGAGFILLIEGGVLKLVEGYSYGVEPWPQRLDGYSLSYMDDERAKLAAKLDEHRAT